MKTILKSLGITISFICGIFGVGIGMAFVVDKIQTGFELGSTNMGYVILGFLVLLVFTITYSIINRKQKELEKKTEKEEIKLAYKKEQEEIKELKTILIIEINRRADEFHIYEYLTNIGYPIIEPDDKVILNKYGLIRSSSSSWDTGVHGIIYYENEKKPIFCNVTGVGVCGSFAINQIDELFNHIILSEHQKENIIEVFFNFIESKINHMTDPIYDKDGLYVNVFFDTLDIKFNPSWGLNIFSFLPADSIEGKRTYDTWEAIYACEGALKAARDSEKKLKETVKNLKSDLIKEFE